MLFIIHIDISYILRYNQSIPDRSRNKEYIPSSSIHRLKVKDHTPNAHRLHTLPIKRTLHDSHGVRNEKEIFAKIPILGC